MNDSSYSILIPVLLLLLAATVGMLYARFASRSTENSEEIDLVDVDLAMSRISVAEAEDDRIEADDTQRVPFLETRPESAPVLEVASSDETYVGEASDEETEYLDELQEAAAGLAALMRSSPVGKSTPVVYAPHDLEDEVVEARNEVAPEDEPQEILMPASESVSEAADSVEPLVEETEVDDVLGEEPTAPIPLEGSDVGFAEVDETSAETTALLEADLSETTEISINVNGDSDVENEVPGETVGERTELLNVVIDDIVVAKDDGIEEAVIENSISEETLESVASNPESEVISLRALLGDEVADQFDTIDEGLSDLESLVDSIESALSSINGGAEGGVSEEAHEAISEAA